MMGAGIDFPSFAFPIDEPTAADDGIGTVGSVPYPRMDESEALPGCNVEGLRVVRGSIDHSAMLSLGTDNDSEVAYAVHFGAVFERRRPDAQRRR